MLDPLQHPIGTQTITLTNVTCIKCSFPKSLNSFSTIPKLFAKPSTAVTIPPLLHVQYLWATSLP